jgi:hypothetical protein
MTQPSVKIFVGYHKPTTLVKNNVFEPIHLGRALATQASKDGAMSKKDYQWMLDNMIGDDTGDNISALNRIYCEMTGYYWMWKHYKELGNPDYIGFCHYRRFFIFKENLFDTSTMAPWLKAIPCYKMPAFNTACEENIKEENIYNLLSSEADVYTIKKYDVRQMLENNLYMKEHYICTIPFAKRTLWTLLYDTVNTLYPEYKEILEEFSYGPYMYCFNMFIMKKDLFHQYCEFSFNVMEHIAAQVDSSSFTNPTELRYMSYLAEYITTLFLLKLEKDGHKIQHLDTIFIEEQPSPVKKRKKSLKLFAIQKTGNHKIIHICGLKFKFRIARNYYADLAHMSYVLWRLENKVSDLQEMLLESRLKQ